MIYILLKVPLNNTEMCTKTFYWTQLASINFQSSQISFDQSNMKSTSYLKKCNSMWVNKSHEDNVKSTKALNLWGLTTF